MTAFLPFTGERFTPEARGAIWYEHWHRYCVALSAVAGKRVLDAACGEGYGSWLLAGAAAEVVGVDIDHSAIAHAVSRTDLADRLHVAAGLELRANLPFGPLSLDVGMGESGARRLDISFGQEF